MLSTDVGAAPAASTLQEGAPFAGASRRESGGTQDDFAAVFDRCTGEATPDAGPKTPMRARTRGVDLQAGAQAPMAEPPSQAASSAGESAVSGLLSGPAAEDSVDEQGDDLDAAADATVPAFDPRFFVPVPVSLSQPARAQVPTAPADAVSTAAGMGAQAASVTSGLPIHARGPLGAFQGLTPRPMGTGSSQPVSVAVDEPIDDPTGPTLPLEEELTAADGSETPDAALRFLGTTLSADEQRAVDDAIERLQAGVAPVATPVDGGVSSAVATGGPTATPDPRAVAMASIRAALVSSGPDARPTTPVQAPAPGSISEDAGQAPSVSAPETAADPLVAEAVEIPAGLENAVAAAPAQAAAGLHRAVTHAAKAAATPSSVQADAVPEPATTTDEPASAPEVAATQAVADDSAVTAGDTGRTATPQPVAPGAQAAVVKNGDSSDDASTPVAAHSRGRVPQQEMAAPPATPRPTARVAHAIAAFQAAANAAGATPAAAQAAFGSGLTPTALLDQELPTQIVQAIRVQFDNGSGAAHVRLNPGFLGGMTVGVSVEGTSVVASLQATSADVREWMQRNESVLRQALADQGLHLERLVIVDEEASPASDEERGNGKQSQQREQEPSKRSRRPASEGTFEVEL